MEENERYWSNLEQLFVHNVYERISSKYDEFLQYNQNKRHSGINREHFASSNCGLDSEKNIENTTIVLKKHLNEKQNGSSSCKRNEWPKVRSFLLHMEPYSLIADVGCGEGKYLNINSLIFPIGSDRSISLSKLAYLRNISESSLCNKNQIVICDNLRLPFKSNLFDAVISIGVIHHLSTDKRRIKAIQELCRVLKPGGRIMIYVWALEQRLRKFKSQDVLVPMLNLNPSSSKLGFKVNLRRDMSNNSAINSEDSNDELFSERYCQTVSLSNQNDNVGLEKEKNSAQNFGFQDSQTILNQDSVKNDTNESELNKKKNFVESLKRFFSQKLLYQDEKTNERPSSVFSKAKSMIEEPTSMENYKKIIDQHKNILPENFTIRKFPNSSCLDTFNNISSQKEKSDLSLSISSMSISPVSPVCSPQFNQTDFCCQQQTSDHSLKLENSENGKDKNNCLNKRFYHVFKKNELDNLINEYCPELKIYDSYYDHGNWSICAQKKN